MRLHVAQPVEALEFRYLFAVTFADNVLTLTGTSAGDVIRVNLVEGRYVAKDPADDSVSRYTATRVNQIVLVGGAGDDFIKVGPEITIPTVLRGGSGDDTLTAGSGNDTLDGGAGADIMHGKEGVDVTDYSTRTRAVRVDLDGASEDDGQPNEGDTNRAIEGIFGGRGDDTLVGARQADATLDGNDGDDLITGGMGYETVLGGRGNDTINGGKGADRINGQAGDDTFLCRFATSIDDSDKIIGGPGFDTAELDLFPRDLCGDICPKGDVEVVDGLPPSQFNIEFNPRDSQFAKYRTPFSVATEVWQNVIIGDLPDQQTDDRTIDDILIDVSFERMDGFGGVLGIGGPTEFRRQSRLPWRGEIVLDTADFRDGGLGYRINILIHEIGHALGFGTLWERLGLIHIDNEDNPRFRGRNAAQAYADFTAMPQLYVPIEITADPDHPGGHWREDDLTGEIMTPLLDDFYLLTNLTVASMADLGYEVNPNSGR